MKNYLKINGKKIALSEEQVWEIKQSFGRTTVKLSDIPAGETFKIEEYEFIVLEQIGLQGVAVALNGLIEDKVTFSNDNTNNYDGSNPDKICCDFEDELAKLIGLDNIFPHEVDLTADDGLKNFGSIQRKVSLMTANERRKYVHIFDKYPLEKWEWLATAYSAPPHDNDNWIKCVASSGYIVNVSFYDCHFGVRPFCILNSNIFVSKGE